jgi:hypothetical protein
MTMIMIMTAIMLNMIKSLKYVRRRFIAVVKSPPFIFDILNIKQFKCNFKFRNSLKLNCSCSYYYHYQHYYQDYSLSVVTSLRATKPRNCNLVFGKVKNRTFSPRRADCLQNPRHCPISWIPNFLSPDLKRSGLKMLM